MKPNRVGWLAQPWVTPLLVTIVLAAVAVDLGVVAMPAGLSSVPASVFALLALLSTARLLRAVPALGPEATQPASADKAGVDAEAALPLLLGMVAMIDAQRRCTQVSPALARWLFGSAEDIVGRPIEEAFGAVNGPKLRLGLDAALAGGAQRLRFSALQADQSLQTLQIELLPETNEAGVIVGCQRSANPRAGWKNLPGKWPSPGRNQTRLKPENRIR